MSAAIAPASDLVAACPRVTPDRPVPRSVKEQFHGTWRLVSWTIEQANGEITSSPLGSAALGWIMYHPDGSMCVALMRPDRPRFASDTVRDATPQEIKAGFEGFMGYCGFYEVEERERFVVHQLELSWFPNWVGTSQKRYFELAGDRLILTTPPLSLVGDAQVHRLVWQRLN